MREYLDLYCERTAAGLWQEPLNTLSNLAFLFAAALLLRRYLQRYRGRLAEGWWQLILIALLGAIGVASGLWHLTGERWAMLADALCIAGFTSTFLLVFLVRVAQLRVHSAIAVFALYQTFNWGFLQTLPPDLLNGSVFYLPTAFALILLTGWLHYQGHALRQVYAWASGLFLLSLSLRSVDLAWCDVWPIGTHFLWHLLNAWLMYLLLGGLVYPGGQRLR